MDICGERLASLGGLLAASERDSNKHYVVECVASLFFQTLSFVVVELCPQNTALLFVLWRQDNL